MMSANIRPGPVLNHILGTISKRPMHMTLLDPDTSSLSELEDLSNKSYLAGTDAIMVGGSTTNNDLSSAINAIKKGLNRNENENLESVLLEGKPPIIHFPTNSKNLALTADAIYFMSCLNAGLTNYITGEQARALPILKKNNLERIPMAYLIVEPGMLVGKVSKADLLRRNDSRDRNRTAGYMALANEWGMLFAYFEAGSKSKLPISDATELITTAKEAADQYNMILVLGGGILTVENAIRAVELGGNIVVTGTLAERSPEDLPKIIDAVQTAPYRQPVFGRNLASVEA